MALLTLHRTKVTFLVHQLKIEWYYISKNTKMERSSYLFSIIKEIE